MTQPQAGVNFFPGENLDTFFLGADPCPGQVRLKRAPNLQTWEIRKGSALSGATVVPQGEDCNEVEFDVELWLPSQQPEWETFAAKYFKKAVITAPAGLDALALSIGYPLLRRPPVSITKVVYKSCSEAQIDEDGLITYSVTFIKYRRPVLAPPRPKTTIPSAAVPQPTAEDAAQQIIQQQQAQVQTLWNQVFPGGQQ